MLPIQKFNSFIEKPQNDMPLSELSSLVNEAVKSSPQIKEETITGFFNALPVYFSNLQTNKRELSDKDWELFDTALGEYVAKFISKDRDDKHPEVSRAILGQLVTIGAIANKRFSHLPKGNRLVYIFGPALQKIILPNRCFEWLDTSEVPSEIHLEKVDPAAFSMLFEYCKVLVTANGDEDSLSTISSKISGNISEKNLFDVLFFSSEYGFNALFHEALNCMKKFVEENYKDIEKREASQELKNACNFFIKWMQGRFMLSPDAEKKEFLKRFARVAFGPLSEGSFMQYVHFLQEDFLVGQGFEFFRKLSKPERDVFFERFQKENSEQANKYLFWLLLNWKIDAEIRATINPRETGIHHPPMLYVLEKGDAQFFIRLGEEGATQYIQSFFEQLGKVGYFPSTELTLSILPSLPKVSPAAEEKVEANLPLIAQLEIEQQPKNIPNNFDKLQQPEQVSLEAKEKEATDTLFQLRELFATIFAEKNGSFPKKIYFKHVEEKAAAVLNHEDMEVVWKAFIAKHPKKQELEKIKISLDDNSEE
jgi:hypothetical protein